VKYLQSIGLTLIIIGGLNWLLIGLFHVNLVHLIFGKLGVVENIVYILVGVAALVCIPMLKDCCSKLGGQKKE